MKSPLFRIEALYDHTKFKVQIKTLFFWKSAYVYTNYFAIDYQTEKEALNAINRYKNRFTYI
jgi:hypothetical protein